MWAEAANPQGLLPPVMRACVMNLIVYVEDQTGVEAVIKAAQDMAGRHPSRLILLHCNPTRPASGVEAWVSAICQMPQPGGRQVCCEQITLVAHGAAADDLHATVLSLFSPDVPVVLWWRAAPDPHRALFRELVNASDYVILDSTHFREPFALWREIRRAFPAMALSDLNWARIRPWRELIAQFFDLPETRPLLHEIEKVSLTFSAHGDERNPTQAFLVAGWLATRLDWTYFSGRENEPGSYDLEMRYGDLPIHVDIRPVEAGSARTGRLLGCVLETAKPTEGAGLSAENAGCEFVVTRRVKEDLIHTRMYLLDRGELACATSLEVRQEHELLMMELDRPGRHPILEDSLEFSSNVLDRLHADPEPRA